jgi:ADP-ribose pyrophosphatase YjhB (NUDIX family)
MKIRKSIKVILINPRDEIVLVRVDDPRVVDASGKYNGIFWNLVGGALEDGETPKKAALEKFMKKLA